MIVSGLMPDPDKRKLRQLKHAIKKRGNKHRRLELKRTLQANPEAAAEAEEDFGRYRSETLNGIDQDSTRRRYTHDNSSDSPETPGSPEVRARE
jgi:hypothetical protein